MTATDISARIDRKEQALRAVAATSENVIAAKSDLEFIRNHYTHEGLEGSNEKQRQARPDHQDRDRTRSPGRG